MRNPVGRVILKSKKKRTQSSRDWLLRQLNDPFVRKAKQEGYRSRAAFKFIEIDEKYKILKPGQFVIDLGAAPGGWTWVIAQLGAQVTAVDKAPLDPAIAAHPGVNFRPESAFGLDPRQESPITWLFSDVICYPARLLGLVRRWIEAEKARNIFCTIKFQGETDHAIIAEFQQIQGSKLFHAAHNKHEVTFARLAP